MEPGEAEIGQKPPHPWCKAGAIAMAGLLRQQTAPWSVLDVVAQRCAIAFFLPFNSILERHLLLART